LEKAIFVFRGFIGEFLFGSSQAGNGALAIKNFIKRVLCLRDCKIVSGLKPKRSGSTIKLSQLELSLTLGTQIQHLS